MSKIFARKIINTAGTSEEYTIDAVPNLWKTSTIKELMVQGYDGFGKPLKEETAE